MKQIYLCLVFIASISSLKADILGDIKKTVKKAEKGTKDIAKKTETGIKSAATQTQQSIEKAHEETVKGVKIGIDKGVPFLEELGKSQYEPFIKPGKELNALKSQMYYGVGSGKTLDRGNTATWRIGTGCIIGVKAWKVQKLKTTVGGYAKMQVADKVNTDIEIVLDEMRSKKKILKDTDEIVYNKFLGDWTVYEVTAGDNQCIHHNFAVKEKNGKISISKTK